VACVSSMCVSSYASGLLSRAPAPRCTNERRFACACIHALGGRNHRPLTSCIRLFVGESSAQLCPRRQRRALRQTRSGRWRRTSVASPSSMSDSDSDDSTPLPRSSGRQRRANVRLSSPSPEEPRRCARPRPAAAAPLRQRPHSSPAPRQPRFTDEGRPMFESWMDAETRRRLKAVGRAAQAERRAVVGQRRRARPRLRDLRRRRPPQHRQEPRSEQSWMSAELKKELMRAWVEQHRFASAPFTGSHSALLWQWRGDERPEGPRVRQIPEERRASKRSSDARRRLARRRRPPGLNRARNGRTCSRTTRPPSPPPCRRTSARSATASARTAARCSGPPRRKSCQRRACAAGTALARLVPAQPLRLRLGERDTAVLLEQAAPPVDRVVAPAPIGQLADLQPVRVVLAAGDLLSLAPRRRASTRRGALLLLLLLLLVAAAAAGDARVVAVVAVVIVFVGAATACALSSPRILLTASAARASSSLARHVYLRQPSSPHGKSNTKWSGPNERWLKLMRCSGASRRRSCTQPFSSSPSIIRTVVSAKVRGRLRPPVVPGSYCRACVPAGRASRLSTSSTSVAGSSSKSSPAETKSCTYELSLCSACCSAVSSASVLARSRCDTCEPKRSEAPRRVVSSTAGSYT